MRSVTAILALSLAALGQAQSVTVTVGGTASTSGGPLQFMPPSVNVTAGSVVTFVFMGAPGNHSVTESSFSDPCDPLAGGFDSGTVFIPPNTMTGFPTWNLTIGDASKPIWFFCKQLNPGPHCTSGMVGAINAPGAGNTFQSFQANAKAFTGTPGQSIGALSGQGAVATAIPGPFSGSITGFGFPGSTPMTTPASGGGGGGGGYGGGGYGGGGGSSSSSASSSTWSWATILFAASLGMIVA